MITHEFFDEYFQSHAETWGWRMSAKRARFIFHDLNQENFNNEDLTSALQQLEKDSFSYSELKVYLRKSRAIRFEEIEREKQRSEANRIKMLMTQTDGSNECAGGDCGKCSIVYCETVAKASMQAIQRIIAGTDSHKENMKLAGKFKGIGFEQVIGLEPF